MAEPKCPPLILASASPRRRELLTGAGVRFEVQPADISERALPDESPEEMALRLAREKALAVARRVGPDPRRYALAADTVVVVDGVAFGKPENGAHAVALLRQLVGRSHRVVTAVALAESDSLAVRDLRVESCVRMRSATVDELRAYVAEGESLDKAGGYAVQGGGRRFIDDIEGSESNVIGLPLSETLDLLRASGFGPGDA